MARLAALLAGTAGFSGCAAAVPAVPLTPRDPRRRVRIGLLVGERTARVGARGKVVAADGGRTALRLDSGQTVQIESTGSALRATGGGVSRQFDSLNFRPAEQQSAVTVDGSSFRGLVSVSARRGEGGGLTVVNEVGLEEYVQGVVAAEMGGLASGEQAALRAQAVAARTYAVANLGRFEQQGFDLRAGVTDQAYRGADVETRDGNRATGDTDGQVLIHDGDVIAMFFHSTCGYATASPEEVFRTVRPRPYLPSVSDRRGDGFFCELSTKFRWSVEWSELELLSVLRSTVPQRLGVEASMVGEIRDVLVRQTGRSGRVTEIRILVVGGEIPVFGPDIRAVFRTPGGGTLGSTAVQLSTSRRDGRVARLTVAGAGWGHGVGLCQWGAIGRARAGQGYRAILATYFPGTAVERWY